MGQVQGELLETQMTLLDARNSINDLQDQLVARESELLLELLLTQQELRQTRQKLESSLPRYFNSLEELKEWLVRDDTNQMKYSSDEFNCIAFALRLQERALVDGYILSTEVLPVAAHWVNIAVIGDRIYVIEPQDDRIILEKRINRELDGRQEE